MQDLFPDRRVPENCEQRTVLVDHLYDQRGALMGELETEFLSQDALMQKQLADWIRVHKLNG